VPKGNTVSVFNLVSVKNNPPTAPDSFILRLIRKAVNSPAPVSQPGPVTPSKGATHD
jgi:hypothetical protein